MIRKVTYMDIDQLRQLEAFAHHGTMSAAANACGLSQSAFSRSIQRLETELGAQLFDRQKNSVHLNETGRAAVAHARSVLREVQLLQDAVDEAQRRARTLRVGTCAPAPLWNLTARIVERFPSDVFNSEMLGEEEIERRVLDGSIDFGISQKPFLLPVIANARLMTETLSIAVAADHPLATRKSVTFDDIDGVDFLLLEDIGIWHDMHRRLMPHSHFVIQKDREVFTRLAEAGTMPVFVTDIPMQRGLLPDRVRIPIDHPAATKTFYLLVRKDTAPRVREIFDWIANT